MATFVNIRMLPGTPLYLKRFLSIVNMSTFFLYIDKIENSIYKYNSGDRVRKRAYARIERKIEC